MIVVFFTRHSSFLSELSISTRIVPNMSIIEKPNLFICQMLFIQAQKSLDIETLWILSSTSSPKMSLAKKYPTTSAKSNLTAILVVTSIIEVLAKVYISSLKTL